MSTCVIRAATVADVAAVARLLDQLNRAEGKHVVTDATKLHAALFVESRRVNYAALVAEMAGEVVGVLLYYPGYDTVSASYGYHLADLVVEESQRRQGIAKQLVAALAAQNLRGGGEWISLTVLKTNDTAKAFYQSLGLSHVPVDFFAGGERALTSLQQLLQK